MKKAFCVFLAIVLFLASSLSVFALSGDSLFITSAKTPTTFADYTYIKKFGSGYKSAPTPPTVVQSTILVVSGVKLYKLNAQTGEEISSVKMQGSTLYSTVAPLFADGKVFVSLDGGIVQAFDFETLSPLWIYQDSLGGQALCPIVYNNGCVYTGFWNDETEFANYVCLTAEDENTESDCENKEAQWAHKELGGFYWAGCYVNDKVVIFGKDDGQKNSNGKSKIISLNKLSGELVSSLDVEGDIRSGIFYSEETDSCYTSSKAGYVYKFSVDSSGKLSSLITYSAGGSVTATPVVYGERLYVGCQKNASGEFVVLDANTMEEIYTCEMPGFPQASMLVSNGYEKETGKIYVYSTYNKKPGGILVFEDSKNQTSAVKTELYSPDASASQYCISTVSASENGTIYYKNDSGNIFALREQSEGFQLFLKKLIYEIKCLLERIAALFAKV